MSSFFSRWHHQLSTKDQKPLSLKLVLLLLLPPSWCYALIMMLRNWAYDHKLLSSYQSSLPIISVGNITVGGTGKTPTVDWLVKALASQGKKAAIVSRGYGGAYRQAVAVVADGGHIRMEAEQCGDEPLLLARKNPVCPVVVARRRVDGVRYVEAHFDVDVIVLDDAFQHRRLVRDFDLVLLDAVDPFGNGWTLPVGKLRESKGALKRADVLLLTRSSQDIEEPVSSLPVFRSRHCLSLTVTRLDGKTCHINELKNKKIYGFSGLAENQRFLDALLEVGVSPDNFYSLPDHVAYLTEIVDMINSESNDCDLLLTTEKDAVKLSSNMFELPCYYVSLHLEITDGEGLIKLISHRLWRQE